MMITVYPAKPGVQITSPGLISGAIKAQVALVLAEIPEGRQGALVGVATEKGVNLAVAHRIGERWEVAFWIGKSFDTTPITGGAWVKTTW